MKYTDRSVYSRSREYPFKRPAGKGACMSVQPDPDLEPPVALVTEATSGIGRAIALKLASDGHYVIVHGRDAQRGKETVQEIESNGGRGRFVPADLTAPGDIARLAADAGAVDVLVNNASNSWFGPTADLDVATFDSLFANDVRAPYLRSYHQQSRPSHGRLRPVQIGVAYPQNELGGDPTAVRRIGRAVEDLGFDHLLAYDHVLGAVHADRTPPLAGPYTEPDPFHYPFVLFAFLAGIPARIGLVTCRQIT